ncbi:protease HtpX [Loigolactobacillus backii]|uniref:zinc metalloprotease HtpX n=1 Tax=Loigolactobacillus backii TaxID=375175 RepID=UPI0007F08260|nr:zinc metalloprotease HtpX [Loigolactobacillus backii]ANK60240.1 protease HtpX [Loigolactobacillus backii]ANK65122.1 protease HtpX [Loigolactobacillus backii]ANK67681.1 protease HtpX [Loigolactobacillus backii]OLF68913.1 heat shock protein HtpX [Loigolactobacillus backii]PIO87093.1 zinc metalloprotease HtpX [Loigolactobacillus backii]
MLYQQIAQNKRKTWLVMLSFFCLLLIIGAAVGYAFFSSSLLGIVLAAIVAAIYITVMVGNSTGVVMGLNHAREVTDTEQYPQLWHIVEDMAMVARVPMPRVFIVTDSSPNAFATGNDPKHAAVAVTTGLLAMMDREELEGVIGHEISHIRNYDIRLATIAMALTAAISLLVNIGMRSFWWGGGRRRSRNNNEGNSGQIILLIGSIVVVILAPIAASLVQMALSRNREYLADASSVELTRNPTGLITALQKIGNSKPMKQADSASAALYIADPFKEKRSLTHLFTTHPPIEQRINRLEHL